MPTCDVEKPSYPVEYYHKDHEHNYIKLMNSFTVRIRTKDATTPQLCRYTTLCPMKAP